MLLEAGERLLRDYCTRQVVLASEQGTWAQSLWDALAQAGITSALASEEAGGSGVEFGEALRLAGVAARFWAPVPLGEHYVATWLLQSAGLAPAAGPLTIAPSNRKDRLTLQREGSQWRLGGVARRVPWARHAKGVVVAASSDAGEQLVLVPAQGYRVEPGSNMAREARDTVVFDAVLAEAAVARAPAGHGASALHACGAALRTVQMAAVLGRALELSLQYAQDRVQFGRAISKFQAIQHHLAVLASQSAAANAAADIALESLDPLDLCNVGAAKTRAGEAASVGAAIAHQVHGAIGFTLEYELNFGTRRLWSWRDEFGRESEWSLAVGQRMAAGGADCLWEVITGTADAGLSPVPATQQGAAA